MPHAQLRSEAGCCSMLRLKSAVKRSVCVPMVNWELATAGSTRPITSRVSHAGIVATMGYEPAEQTTVPGPGECAARLKVIQGQRGP
jgi:hypothetical protein